MALTDEDGSRAHGVDERIPVDALRRGVEMNYALVVAIAGMPSKPAPAIRPGR